MCEMTGAPGAEILQASHILPLACVNTDMKYEPLWQLLAMFWKLEDVNELRGVVVNNPNSIANGLRLAVHAHVLLDALKLYLAVDWDSVDSNGDVPCSAMIRR